MGATTTHLTPALSRRPLSLQVGASEEVVRERIKSRAAATGRDVPEHLIVKSLASVATSLDILMPLGAPRGGEASMLLRYRWVAAEQSAPLRCRRQAAQKQLQKRLQKRSEADGNAIRALRSAHFFS